MSTLPGYQDTNGLQPDDGVHAMTADFFTGLGCGLILSALIIFGLLVFMPRQKPIMFYHDNEGWSFLCSYKGRDEICNFTSSRHRTKELASFRAAQHLNEHLDCIPMPERPPATYLGYQEEWR